MRAEIYNLIEFSKMGNETSVIIIGGKLEKNVYQISTVHFYVIGSPVYWSLFAPLHRFSTLLCPSLSLRLLTMPSEFRQRESVPEMSSGLKENWMIYFSSPSSLAVYITSM